MKFWKCQDEKDTDFALGELKFMYNSSLGLTHSKYSQNVIYFYFFSIFIFPWTLVQSLPFHRLLPHSLNQIQVSLFSLKPFLDLLAFWSHIWIFLYLQPMPTSFFPLHFLHLHLFLAWTTNWHLWVFFPLVSSAPIHPLLKRPLWSCYLLVRSLQWIVII